MKVIGITILLLVAGQRTNEEQARALFNQALLAPIDESDKLLDRIIVEFPTTTAATEAIKLRAQRRALREYDAAEKRRADEDRKRQSAEAVEQAKRDRSKALGGYEISEIMSHGLAIPVPNNSTTKREGTNPEIIKLEAGSGVAANISSFYYTVMKESKTWKPVGSSFTRCWTQQHEQVTERLCIDTDSYLSKATLYVTTLKEQ